MTTRKSVGPPALIDPPDPLYGTLEQWLEFRDVDLAALAQLPGIERFIREADRVIARLSTPEK